MVTRSTEPNQTKPGKRSEKGIRHERSLQRTSSSLERDTEEKTKNQKDKQNQINRQYTAILYAYGMKSILFRRLRKKGSPISSGIQPRQEDQGKGKGNEQQSNRMKDEVYRHREKHREGLAAQTYTRSKTHTALIYSISEVENR